MLLPGTYHLLNKTNSLTSTSTYDKTFTFFVKGKVTSNGQLFTSFDGNKLFGWYGSNMKFAWMDGNIFGVTSNTTPNDSETHNYTFTNNNDAKKFYEEKTLTTENIDGKDTWEGKVVIGK